MSKLKFWVLMVVIILLVGAFLWYVGQRNQHGASAKTDTFVYNEHGKLYWIEITGQRSNIEGTIHQRSISEKPGEVPEMVVKDENLTGETAEKGYVFTVNDNGKKRKFDARFSRSNLLLVKEQGKKETKTFHAAKDGELEKYVNDLHKKLQKAIDRSEEKEKTRMQTFFSKLNSTYGFLYTAKNGEYQLFLKIDEALHQGELEGSLLVVTDTGDTDDKPYEETSYVLHGMTDGLMVEFFTTSGGKETKMKGTFHKDASGLDLTFWKTDRNLTLDAVTEKEFEQKHHDFKAGASRGEKEVESLSFHSEENG